MKIAILADTLPGNFVSGAGVYNLELVKGLIGLHQEVLLFAPKQQFALPAEIKKSRIIYLPAIPSPYPGFKLIIPYTPKVLREIRKFKPDIIYSSAPSFLGIDGLATAKLLRIPSVSTFQTMFTDKKYIKLILKTHWGSKSLEKISWKYHRWFYGSQDGVLVSTPIMKQILVNKGISESKIHIIPLSTDLRHIKKLSKTKKEQLKKKYNLNENVALYMGRISQEKSLDELLLIWSKVVKKNSNVSLVMIGDGPYVKKLKSLISKLRLEEYVKPIGAIEHQKMMQSGILSLGDFFISASVTETFGLAMVEAMAHNLPVVLYKSQGIAEFIKDSGIICRKGDRQQFRDAILRLINEHDLRIKMGDESTRVALQFNTEEVIKNTLKLFQDIIEKKKN